MTERGIHTYAEILSQPEAWESVLKVMRTLPATPAATEYEQVIFTGCGSTYYLSVAAASLYSELTGRLARAFPASELWLNPRLTYPTGMRTLLVAVSRSGETSETIHACEQFRADKRGPIITLVNYPESPLASLGDVNIHLPSGQETSLCQTRAFSTLYLATTWLSVKWAGDATRLDQFRTLPEAVSRLLNRYGSLSQQLGSDLSLERFYFLGSGSRHGLASELSLKMKEMSLSDSEPFHFMEFRHGPKSMISPTSLVIGLRSESNRAYEQAVLKDLAALGGQFLVMDNQDAQVSFDTTADEALRNVLYLPVGQLFAYWRSMSKGLNPDLPHNLDMVVKLG